MVQKQSSPVPRPLSSASREVLSSIECVFFDIDDTFSSHGKILPEAYAALWRLHRAGIRTVPVTGRPAGWCDFIARMWPVDAVVGENGAFYSFMSVGAETGPRREAQAAPKGGGARVGAPSKLVKKYLESPSTRAANAKKLIGLHKAISRAFPRARTPSDQLFREFDLAIDYCEDVPRWPNAEVDRLLEFARARGAIAKLSSIHVNMWFGKYDKWRCVERVLSEFFSIDPKTESHKIIYVGDSPNDEPFFERLPLTVGVANVREFLDRMRFAPAFITRKTGGLGFAELAERLLESRDDRSRRHPPQARSQTD